MPRQERFEFIKYFGRRSTNGRFSDDYMVNYDIHFDVYYQNQYSDQDCQIRLVRHEEIDPEDKDYLRSSEFEKKQYELPYSLKRKEFEENRELILTLISDGQTSFEKLAPFIVNTVLVTFVESSTNSKVWEEYQLLNADGRLTVEVGDLLEKRDKFRRLRLKILAVEQELSQNKCKYLVSKEQEVVDENEFDEGENLSEGVWRSYEEEWGIDNIPDRD